MQFYFQGEPLLNKQLPEMIAKAHAQGLYTIVSTNAQLLTQSLANRLVKSGLDHIIVSIDGISQASYEAYRVGGKLHLALDGLRYLNTARQQYHSRICIEMQVLRLKTNENEWKWISQHYRMFGATKLTFKTAQLYNYRNGHPLMPSQLKYARYRRTADGTYILYRSLWRRIWPQHPCYRLWSGCVINTRGQVLPCCYDKASQFTFGSIHQTDIKNVWQSESAKQFRKTILDKQHLPLICQECNY